MKLSKTSVPGSVDRDIPLRSIVGGRADEPRTTPYRVAVRENLASETQVSRAYQSR